jgi:hypothetical protein
VRRHVHSSSSAAAEKEDAHAEVAQRSLRLHVRLRAELHKGARLGERLRNRLRMGVYLRFRHLR